MKNLITKLKSFLSLVIARGKAQAIRLRSLGAQMKPFMQKLSKAAKEKLGLFWRWMSPTAKKLADEFLKKTGTLMRKIGPPLQVLAQRVLEKGKPFFKKLSPIFEKIKPLVQPWWIRLQKLPRTQLAIWGIAGILIIGVAKAVLFPGKEPAPAKPEIPPEEQVLPVKVFKVSRFNYEDSLNALGNIKGSSEFKLSFEIPGVINSINYREGERYEEGALLISLRQDDIVLRLKRSQAEMNKADTALAIAEEKLREHKKLFEIGAIPQTTLEKVKLEVDSAGYELEAAKMEVKANESMLEKSNLYAPTDGRIGELYVEEGEAITPNTLIGSHVATDVVYAEFGAVERDLTKLSLGQKAKVYVDAYPDKTFEGLVENISPVVLGSSRTATARVRIDNPEGLLLPGMFARVKILLFAKRNTLAVPTDSVQGTEEESFVWAVDPKTNQVSKKKIRIGYKRPDYAQVDAGLEDEDLVCVSGFEKLTPGMKVKIVEKQEVEQ